jgi:hypothetical protein
MIRALTVVVLAAILLPGCVTTYTLVEPKRQTIAGVISVEPGTQWNKVSRHNYRGNVELWTLDGPTLNTLLFFTGVADGAPLFTPARGAAPDDKPPVFRATMNPLEVQELLEDTAARYFRTTLAESGALKATPVAQGEGFRFETRLVGRDEVERDGVFVGTIRNQKLYGAWFQGARLHYYGRYLPEFDRLLASAQLVGDAAR